MPPFCLGTLLSLQPSSRPSPPQPLPCSVLGRQRLDSLVLAGLPASSFFTLSQIQAEPSCQMDSPLQRGPGSCSQSFSTSVALQTLAVTVRSSAGHQKYSTLNPPTTPAVPDYSNLSIPMAAPRHPGVMVSSHGLAFLSVSPSSSLSQSLHIYSPTNPSGLARCLSSPYLPLSLRQKRSVACHPFQFLPATSILGHPSNQTVRLGALLGAGVLCPAHLYIPYVIYRHAWHPGAEEMSIMLPGSLNSGFR